MINKVDKPNCRPDEVQEAVYDLMFELDATEEQLEFPTVFGSAKHGWMGPSWEEPTDDIVHLLDQILEVIPPPQIAEGPAPDAGNLVGLFLLRRPIAIGRLFRGEVKENMPVTLIKRDGEKKQARIKELQVFEGLGRQKVEKVGGWRNRSSHWARGF